VGHLVQMDLMVHLVQKDLAVQMVLMVLGCLQNLCLQLALRVLLDPDFQEGQEILEVRCLIQEVQHSPVGQIVLMVRENLVVQKDLVALVGQLTLVDLVDLMDLKNLVDQAVQLALCRLGYQTVQTVPEVRMVLAVQLALGFLKDRKDLMDPVAPQVHSILLVQMGQVVLQFLKNLGLHLVQEIQLVLVVLALLKDLEDLD
jgi:hypothetical protein